MGKSKNGEGSIRPRETAAGIVYDVQLTVRDRKSGLSRRMFKGGFKTERAAVDWRNSKMRQSDRGGLVREQALTVPEVVVAWMQATTDGKAPTTLKSYDVSFRNHILPRLNVRISALTEATMRTFARETAAAASGAAIGKSGRSTATAAFRTVQSALNWAARRDVGLIDRNPIAGISLPLAGKAERGRAMPLVAIRRLLEVARPESAIIWRLLMETGTRRGEMTGLNWADVDFETGIVNIEFIGTPESGGKRRERRNKTHHRRPVPLSQPLLDLMKERAAGMGPGDPVLTGRDGTRLGFSTYARWWRRDMKAAGLDPDVFPPHSLRHTWATEALAAGVPVKVVSSILGHSSAATTLDIYGHASPEAQQAAVDAVSQRFAI